MAINRTRLNDALLALGEFKAVLDAADAEQAKVGAQLLQQQAQLADQADLIADLKAQLATTQPPATPGWKLAWADEFDTTSLDLNKWKYDALTFGSGNKVNNVNMQKNVYIRDSKLILKCVREQTITGGITYPFSAASVQSKAPFELKKGQAIETRFRTGSMLSGMWPAVWVSAPQSGDDSEIDFVELFGNRKIATVGIFWDYSPTQKDQKEIPFNDTNWHVWRAEWEAEVRHYLDGKLIYTVPATSVAKMTNNPQLVRVTLQIGGTWGGPIDGSLNTAEIETDYVRVFDRV